MNTRHTIRWALRASVLLFLAAPALSFAAGGENCIVRGAGAASASNAQPGHVDADGKCVAGQPAKDQGDDGLAASAQCRDLSYSYNKRRDNACAKHGGVLEWLAQQ